MGAGFAASHAAPLARTDRRQEDAYGGSVRSGLLPVSGQCPRRRASNPCIQGRLVFENDFAALKTDIPNAEFNLDGKGLLRANTERGICRVLCFDPRHDLTLASMTVEGTRAVVAEWANPGSRPGRAKRDSVRADLRESRSHDGRQQSPSSWADLGDRAHPQ